MQQVYDVANAMMSPSKTSRLPLLLSFDLPATHRTKSEVLIASEQRDNYPSIYNDSKNLNSASDKFDHSILEDVNPDEEMAILDHLLGLQQHDQDYEKSKKQEDIKLIEMDGELEQQETLLLQLRSSLKVYHGLKGKYEQLMEEVQQLENEKSNLAKQLDRARTDPKNGCSVAIKRKLEKVEMNLSRARREKRYAEDQDRKCKVLERKVHELKHAKSVLQKIQKEDAARYRKVTEAKTKELLALKRKAKTADKRMSKLENELHLQKKTLSRRTQYCTKLSEKLKKTESHLVKLLAFRQRDMGEHKGSITKRSRRNPNEKGKNPAKLLTEEEVKATKYIFDRMVLDKVKQARLKKRYEEMVLTYSETMRKVVSEVKRLKESREKSVENDHNSMEQAVTMKDIEENIADLEFKLELLDSEMQDVSAQLPNDSKSSEKDTDDAVTKLMNGLSSAALKSTLFETFSKFVEAETERQNITDLLGRKDAALIGLESEVDSLQLKVKLLSKELADRNRLDEAGNDCFHMIKQLTDEKENYCNQLSEAHTNIEESKKTINQLEDSLCSLQGEMSVAAENLAVAKVTLKREGESHEVNETLACLQQIWKELGVDNSVRENAQKRIEFCFEDTCSNVLDNATTMKESTTQEIEKLSHRLQMITGALGISQDKDTLPSSEPLLRTLADLKHKLNDLEVPFRFASARRRKIVEDVRNLTEVLGLSTAELHIDLQILLQNESDDAAKTDEGSHSIKNTATNEGNPICYTLPVRSLETNFLTKCEGHVSELRVAKSEKLLRDRELQQRITELINEMHLSRTQSLDLIVGWIKTNESTHMTWWDTKIAEDLLQETPQTKRFVSSSPGKLSRHLALVARALSTSADSRRLISEALRSVIEHAQKTLLDIVGREIDASEAYTGFHDALFRMPPLSKDLILSCISELEALIDGIEAMTQSETEALTVVWEALKISQKDRRNFWEILEKSESSACLGVKQSAIFLEKFSGSASAHEAWMVEAATSARNFNRILEKRLKKLEGINNEVESLRSKQDMKSQILSLDSEIRIMNTKLLEFEELQCTKQRLLTKKNGGSALLKEERFRKQMKSKFLANLKQLVNLLRFWESKEKTLFDDSLLSDDVRELLKKDPDQMDNWVEMRTKLMPLRTTKASAAKKRSHEDSGSSRRQRTEQENSRPFSRLTPPRKRMTPTIVRNRSTIRTTKDADMADSRMVKDNKISGFRQRDVNVNLEEQVRSPKLKKRKQETAALPFGTILADTPTKSIDNT